MSPTNAADPPSDTIRSRAWGRLRVTRRNVGPARGSVVAGQARCRRNEIALQGGLRSLNGAICQGVGWSLEAFAEVMPFCGVKIPVERVANLRDFRAFGAPRPLALCSFSCTREGQAPKSKSNSVVRQAKPGEGGSDEVANHGNLSKWIPRDAKPSRRRRAVSRKRVLARPRRRNREA